MTVSDNDKARILGPSYAARVHNHNSFTCDPMFNTAGEITNPYFNGACPRVEDFSNPWADAEERRF